MYILYVLNFFILCNCTIKFHFTKKYHPSNINETFDYINYLNNNSLITDLLIGTPLQKIPVSIRYDLQSFYLTKPSSQGLFNSEKSETFSSNFSIREFPEEIEKGYIANDNINLILKMDNTLKENIIPDITFFYITEPNATILDLGSIGLYYKEYSFYKNLNFLLQMKKKKLIDNYAITYQFTSETEGDIYIGNYPHEYNESYYDSLDFYHFKTGYSGWTSFFDKISYGNEVKFQEDYFYLNMSLGGIIGNKFLINRFEKLFFRNKRNEGKCKNKTNNNYVFYFCDSDVDISDFKNLSFYSKEMNFTFVLTYKDLFEVINGKKFCKLIFNQEMGTKWILGQPFLKKYINTFDQDKQLFGIYKKTKDKQIFFDLYIFIVIILVIVIGILSYVLYKYINKKHRRIRINELDNNIDYTPINDNH